MNWKSFLIVLFVWLLIFFLSFSYFSLFLPALYQQNKIQFYILAISSFILLIIGCISYFKAITISPGYINTDLKQQYKDKMQNLKYQAEQSRQFKKLRKIKKLTYIQGLKQIQKLKEIQYCPKCDNVKLPRVHHCKQCQKCIERMDHHCPWVGNCIGKYNHKYFILFLLYVTIVLALVFFSILCDIITGQTVMNHLLRRDELYYYIILTVCLMSCLLILIIGFLLITQIMIVLQNVTTLESFYNGIFQNNPFDSGSVLTNFKQIMGNSFYLLPTQPFFLSDMQKNSSLYL